MALTQVRLLTVLQRIMDECIPTARHSRDYRAKFPEELLADDLGNHLLFAAEVSQDPGEGGGVPVLPHGEGLILGLLEELSLPLHCTDLAWADPRPAPSEPLCRGAQGGGRVVLPQPAPGGCRGSRLHPGI